MEEFDLVQAAQAGSSQAFNALISPYLKMVQYVALRMTQEPDLAEDLAQEALLQAYLSLSSLQDPTRFRSWLYGITLNVCRTYWRQQKMLVIALEVLYDEMPDTASAMPENQIEEKEQSDFLAAAIDTLSPANRTAIRLFYFEGFTLREGAINLGISINAFKARLYKARQQLYRQLLWFIDSDYMNEQEKNIVIPFIIIDVLHDSAAAGSSSIVLFNKETQRELYISVDESVGVSATQLLTKDEALCPCIPLFLGAFLSAVETSIERIELTAANDEHITAHLVIGHDRIDAPLGDAVLMAVQMGKPIFVMEPTLIPA